MRGCIASQRSAPRLPTRRLSLKATGCSSAPPTPAADRPSPTNTAARAAAEPKAGPYAEICKRAALQDSWPHGVMQAATSDCTAATSQAWGQGICQHMKLSIGPATIQWCHNCRVHLSGRVLLKDVIAPKLPVKQQSSCSAWEFDSQGLYTARPDQGSALEDRRGMHSCESCSHPESQALQGSGKAAPAPHPSTLLPQCGPPHAHLQICPLHEALLPFMAGHMCMWSSWSEPIKALTGKLDINLARRVVYSR